MPEVGKCPDRETSGRQISDREKSSFKLFVNLIWVHQCFKILYPSITTLKLLIHYFIIQLIINFDSKEFILPRISFSQQSP